MMPSASTKPEIKASAEAIDPIKNVIQVVEKKVRNLEKRKIKLDSYRELLTEGKTLEKEQSDAVAKYDTVMQNLEFARDLQKQFLIVLADTEKGQKKAAKREKLGRQAEDVRRFKEVLQLQHVLDNMGLDNVRNDFKHGSGGAMALTEENLDQFDELYKLISPSREAETSFDEQLSAASDHLLAYVEARDKAVIGTTTYKEIRDLVEKILQCGYFDNMPNENTENPEEPDEEPEEETKSKTEYEPSLPATTSTQEHVSLDNFGDSVPTLVSQPAPVEAAFSAAPEVPQAPASTDEELDSAQPTQSGEILTQNVPEFSGHALEQPASQETYYSAPDPAVAPVPQRNFREIVSSVQGNFHFLQDSEIDLESPQMDPAVVHVTSQPMPMQQHSESQPSFAGMMEEQHSASVGAAQQSGPVDSLDKQTPSQISGYDAAAASAVSQGGAGLETPYGVSDQAYSHDLMSQSLQSSQHASWAEQTALGASMEDTSVAFGTVQDVAPAIPMPNQSEPVQSFSTQAMDAASAQTEKKFAMNPEAPLFFSSYSQTSVGSMGQDTSASMQSSMSSDMDEQKSMDQGGYQNNQYGGFGHSGFGDRRGNRGGGGRGYRGGNRGNNMSNGYTPRGGRNNGPYNGRRDYNNRPNGRGGSGTFQGYPPRSDYRPEGGYQSFSNGFSSSTGVNKKGSGGAPYRGDRSRGSVPRGGPSRGGFSGPRGGRGSGGFGRPNSGVQMTQGST